ncbi:MAG: rubrerythrin family protein [Chloroflexi bacterium]|jgi:rubrerythrin|nr:rubrerythrin family protein [Chloroflexota bacterium]MBT7079982.1 rubrerythrin family protein [Chloroflexota bacterium]MBT7290581.1 rubrerythrin family protein [Chloroflexota bacterium]
MGNTNDNLSAAFAGESQASRKYTYFAEVADKEGNAYIARLFRAAADAETAHARNHLNVLGGIKSSVDNLKAAIEGEHHEFTSMYPDFIEQAGKEDNNKAAGSFQLANTVEKIHHTLYSDALAKLEKGEAIEDKSIYVCQYCGNTVVGDAPERCPICGVPQKRFKLID